MKSVVVGGSFVGAEKNMCQSVWKQSGVKDAGHQSSLQI